MLSRRTLLGAAVLAAAGPVLAAVPANAAAATTLPVDLINRRSGQQLFAHVMGLDPTTGRWFFLASDGRTRIDPGSPAAAMTPLTGVAIPLGAAGTRKRITLPAMASGRMYLSAGRALQFFVNPGGGIVHPSVANPADPNFDLQWTFCEMTMDANGIYANITFVDFVSLAVGLTLDTATGQQSVGGLYSTGLASIAQGLTEQAAKSTPGWRDLIVTRNGKVLRVLSPNLASLTAGWTGALNGYLDPYIAQVWQKYRTTDLLVDTSSWGTKIGRVGTDNLLRFKEVVGSFAAPSSYAVFNCSVAPFVTTNDVMGNLTARIAAALNRGTLLANPKQPDTSNSAFYRAPVTNHYARLVHAATAGGAGYAFPYDDVHAGTYNTEGRVVDGKPTLLTIRVG